jgi:hypothetical protein
MDSHFTTRRIDMFEIEREARRLRAEATRAGIARLRDWFAGHRTQKAGQFRA